ncbi:photosystem reaction center subunit H [Sphingomonas sp. DBB INV C78]|uniref:PRC-barrel domain containing protein n=1 Tax=Sphingomonas sp. DBB INV C78 TaxID=3349434 RepID=UPI0036D3E4C6
MEDIAGWVAPIATMIAAMMTAANLGPRVTGWGFVVFSVGSIAWTVVALATDQQNLLLTNLFLALVNIVGIWRWLGREARLEDGAEAAQRRSRLSSLPDLFPLNALEGRAIEGPEGERIGTAAGAMAEADSGRISYVVIRTGGLAGVGETLHAMGWGKLIPTADGFKTTLTLAQLIDLPAIDPADWPARAG